MRVGDSFPLMKGRDEVNNGLAAGASFSFSPRVALAPHFPSPFPFLAPVTQATVIMIDSSKKRNSLVGVEVQSPYVIERRSKKPVNRLRSERHPCKLSLKRLKNARGSQACHSSFTHKILPRDPDCKDR